MRRDEKVRAIEKGGRASNPENHHFLGWSSRSVASRGHPYRQIKKIIIDRQSSNWEKGLRKQSSLQKGVQLASSPTQVKLHLLNFRADDPNNWEVAEFLPERVSNQGLLTFGSRFNTIARRKRKSNDHIGLQKKQGRCTLRIGTWHRFNSHRAKQLSSLGHKQLFACIKKRRHGALLIQTAWNWLKRMCHNLTSYPWQRLRNKWFRYCNLRTHSNKVCHGLPFTRCPDQGYLNRIVTNTPAYPYMTNGHIRLTSPNWFHEGVCTHPSQQYTVRVDFPFSFLLARMGHSSLSDRSHKEMVIKAKCDKASHRSNMNTKAKCSLPFI